MRTIPSALQDHLNTGTTTLAWCWKIIRRDNVVMGFTNHDLDLTFDGVTYEASTGFLGTEIESSLGLSVDNMDVMGAVDSSNITEADILAGRYDDAEIQIYLVNWSDTSERLLMKEGNLGEIKRGRTTFTTELRGLSNKTQQVKGRLYNYTCDAILGDGRCRKVLTGSDFTGSGTVLTTNGTSTLTASGLGSYESRWFAKGAITFTSGLNNGVTREVQSHATSGSIATVNVWQPFPFTIAVSDTFSIVAGCDKLWKTCKAKFNNGDNFRGFPHIPGSNALVQYANTGDPNLDGGGNYFGKD